MDSVPQILNALSDEYSLHLFYQIFREGSSGSKVVIKQLKITPKQYYSRLSRLTKSGLIKKKNGKYSPTSLGWVVHEALKQVESGVNYYWKLKAIDSIGLEFSEKERNKIIEQLIDKGELRELLMKKLKEDQSKKK